MVQVSVAIMNIPIDKRAVIIPALNEAASISSVVMQARKYGSVFVINDGSTDDTANIAKAAGATIVNHANPKGYDGALSSGFDAAQKAGFLAAISIDADGQLPIEMLPEFFDKIEQGYDMVVGERTHLPRISEWIFSQVLKCTGSSVRDPFCGLKAYRLSYHAELGHFDSYKSIGTELMIYVLRRRAKVLTVPISVVPRDGTSRMGPRLRTEFLLLKAMVRGLFRLWFSPLAT